MDHGYEETIFSLSAEAPRPPERRRNQRHLRILRVGTLLVAGRRELCLIRNISAGGLMAHVYSSIQPGEEVAVELKPDRPLAGRVSWAADSNIGMAFDRPIDVEQMLAPAAFSNGWHNRLPRVEVDRLGELRIGAKPYFVSTIDISQGGVKVECDQPLPVGGQCVLNLEKFRPIPAVIRWSNDQKAGLSFNQIIPFQELMAWLR